MNANETSSAVNSGATSSSAPAKAEPKADSTSKKSGLTEAQFLARQAEEARLAMGKTWTDLKHSITNNADVRQWTQQYPWIATAAAVAAGVAAGYTLTPRSKDEALEMWEHLKEHFTPAETANGDGDTAKHTATASQNSSVLGSILREAMKVAAPILASLASGAFSGNAGPSDNGHDKTSTPSADAKPPA